MFTSPSSFGIPVSSPVSREDIDDDKERKCENCTEDDPAVAYCPDCSIFLCLVCNDYHKRDKRSRSHDIISLSERRRSKSNVHVCAEHDYELKHYCETCEELVCLYCTLKTHSTHNHDTIKKMANKHRCHLKEVTAPLDKMIEVISEAQNNIEKVKRNILEQGEEVEKKIDQHYHELVEQLMQQKEKVKQQARNIVSQKVTAVATQLEEIGGVYEELCSIKKLNNTLEEGSDQDALSSKKQVLESMKSLTSRYKKLNTQPIESATVEFVSAKEDIPQYGQVYAYVNPASSEVLNFPKYTYKGVKVDFTVITKYSNGRRYPKGGSQVSVEVESAGEVTTVNVKDNNDGSYTASFAAHNFGKLDVSVTIGGLHIGKSPFSVLVIKNYPSIDKPNRIIDIDGKMGVPWGIAFGRYGIWAVADYSYHCIYIFDAQDRMVRKFGTQGTNIGQFQSPGGLAFDNENNLYVADHYNHRIQKFDSNGNYILSIGSQRSGEGHLGCPVGIIIHSERVYVTEQDNKRISVFQTNGSFCFIIGHGHLSNPFDIAINLNGHLLVSDCVHNCIFTFTLDGRYEGKFGPPGSGRGQLNNPRSITTDSNGFIFVAEFGNHRVSIFDKDGNFMHCFGSRGSAYGQFQSPLGVALSSNENIYVSDGYGKRIQVFTAY